MRMLLISFLMWVLPSLVLLALNLTATDIQGPLLEACGRRFGCPTL